MNVHEHLEAASRLPWRWGGGRDGFEGEDCTVFAANWALALTGKDPGEGLRETYSTADQALAIVRRAGGVEAFIDRQLRSKGWIRIAAEPRDGDIGVVLAPLPPDGALGEVPSIRAGGLWVGRSIRGQVAFDFKAVSIWRWKAGPLADLGSPAPRALPPMPRQEFAGSTSLAGMPRQMQQTGIIEGIILLGLTSAGLGAAALNIAVPLLTGLVTTGISLGVNALLQAAFAPKPPKPEDGKAPKTQGIPPRIYAMGRNRIAGYYMLWESKGETLYSVLAIAAHLSHAFIGYYLHDDAVTFAAPSTKYPTMQEVAALNDGRYGQDRILIETRLGQTPETAYAGVVGDLGPEGVWTNAHRGDGQTSLAMICRSPSADNFQKRFPNGIPQPSVLLEGARVWDFRNPAQDPENPLTWGYSRNPALLLCWFQCFCPFGPQRDYTQAILPVIDVWQEEADICDEPIALSIGGTEPRYQADGWSTTENDPKATLNSLLNACDGWFCERGDGAVLFRVGKFREELVETITDADLVGYFVQNDVEEENEINRLVPKFTYPQTDYTTTDTDFFEDTAAQIIVGRVLSQDVDLGWVQSWRQARRCAKREWLRVQQKRRGTLDLRLSAINAVYARWVRIESVYKLPRMNNVLIENRRSVIALVKGGFQMEFVQHPDNIDVWNPATDEGAAPPVPLKPTQSDVETATLDTLISVANGSSVYLRASVIEPISDSLTPLLRYRIKDVGGGVPGEWIEQAFPDAEPAGGLIVLNSNPVIDGNTYQVQVAFRASGGTKGDWRPIVPQEIAAVVDTTPPVALTSFNATGGLGRATLAFVTASDSHLNRIAIYRVPTGAALNKTTHARIVIGAAPGTTFSHVDGDATRTNLLVNPNCDSDTGWTKGAGWAFNVNRYTHTAGSSGALSQPIAGILAADVMRYGLTVLDRTASGVLPRLSGGTAANGTSVSANGSFLGTITANAGNTTFAVDTLTSAFAGSVDTLALFKETSACAPQGVWDYHAFPLNASGLEGPAATPVIGVVVT